MDTKKYKKFSGDEAQPPTQTLPPVGSRGIPPSNAPPPLAPAAHQPLPF